MSFHSAKVVALVLGFALVAAAAPAEAKKRKSQDENALNAVQPKTAKKQERGTRLYPSGPVYHANEYLGDDPDPFIRSQLMRDLGAHYGPPD